MVAKTVGEALRGRAGSIAERLRQRRARQEEHRRGRDRGRHRDVDGAVQPAEQPAADHRQELHARHRDRDREGVDAHEQQAGEQGLAAHEARQDGVVAADRVQAELAVQPERHHGDEPAGQKPDQDDHAKP